MLTRLYDSGITPKPIEYFLKRGDPQLPCIAMERVGSNLQTLRSNYAGIWPHETLGSIGIQLISMVDKLHNDYNLLHKDLHLGNVCLGDDTLLSDHLFLIDLGDMTPVETTIKGTADFFRLDEVRQAVLSIRYLFDGDSKFYVSKRYQYDRDDACSNDVPKPLCDALEYVYSIPIDTSEIDYEYVKNVMREMAGPNSQDAKINWTPFTDKYGQPADLAVMTATGFVHHEGQEKPPSLLPQAITAAISSDESTTRTSITTISSNSTSSSKSAITMPTTMTVIYVMMILLYR